MTTIQVPDMCKLYQSLLIHQAKYSRTDPWRALIVISQAALFQAATADPLLHERIGNDITRITEIGCLACFKPDAFGEIVEAAKDKHDTSAIKCLGESWIKKPQYRYRGDGWPLCPECGEDELADLSVRDLPFKADPTAELKYYVCGWSGTVPEKKS